MEKVKENKRIKLKGVKGITLIALVITIIILLILAGISISTLTGNGLFEKSKQAKNEQMKAEIKERLELIIQEIQIEKIGRATLEDITSETIENKLKEYNITLKEIENGTKIVTIEKNGIKASYNIDEKLRIKEENEIKDNLNFKYEVQFLDNNKINIAITLQEKTNGISKVEFLDTGEIVELENSAEEKTINHELGTELECKLKITLSTGENIEKNIKLNKTETIVDLQNAEYSGSLSYLEKLEDRIVIKSVSGWEGIYVYMDNINLTAYDQIQVTFSFVAGYDWAIKAMYPDNTYYVFDYSGKTGGSGNSVSQRTKTYNIPKDRESNKLGFGSSSLNAKLNIYDITLIKYK